MFSKGNKSKEERIDINGINQLDVTYKYLGIKDFPSLICSPLREDNHPSFCFYCPKENEVNYIDYGTKDSGTIYSLLTKLWNCDYKETLRRIYNDLGTKIGTRTLSSKVYIRKHFSVQCKIREWQQHDVDYWQAYGITLDWLKYANVYPISYKIITKDNNKYLYKADKYAYVYVEFKDNKPTLKIYQPYNKNGHKWTMNADKSVWSLWTKIPNVGKNLIITSSLKDALNIMCNLHIPSICMQGEGYLPKPQIIKELKSRYKNIIVFFDNDFQNQTNNGHQDALMWVNKYNFKMVEIPAKYKAKDPSDLYKKYGKTTYLHILKTLLKNKLL